MSRIISAAQFDREQAEKREAGAATPETTTPAGKGTQGAPIFDHSREHTGDIDIDRAFSITAQQALIPPPGDLEGEYAHAYSALARVSR
jgi:hypothetical protein